MTNPTLSYGDGLLDDFVDFWDWNYESETTALGLVTTTIDTVRTEGDDVWNGYYIKYLTGLNAGESRLITDFDAASDTFTHLAFANVTAAGDEYVLSKYAEALSNMAAGDATPTLDPEDVLKLEGVCDSGGAAEECAYYEYDLPTNLDTDVYTKLLVRHKVSDAEAACRIVLVFTAGTQDIDLAHSTTWKVTATTITPAKTLDKIRVYFQHDLGDADGTYYSYYDFIKVCKGVFTFPHVAAEGKSGGIFPRFTKSLVKLHPLGRGGDVTQDLGFDDAEIMLRGDVLHGESWGTPVGQHILDIYRNDEWSWFTSDAICCKVQVKSFTPAQDVASQAVCIYDLVLSQVNNSDQLDDVWDGVEGWLGIT